MSEKLAGTTAIITGAAAGIGAATAKRFAREGAAIVVADKDGSGAERIAGEIAAKGGRATSCQVDVCDLVELETMLAQAKRVFGRIHVLVNNAGQGAQVHFLETTMETWKRRGKMHGTQPYRSAATASRKRSPGLSCSLSPTTQAT